MEKAHQDGGAKANRMNVREKPLNRMETGAFVGEGSGALWNFAVHQALKDVNFGFL
jgi:hypothetical protein